VSGCEPRSSGGFITLLGIDEIIGTGRWKIWSIANPRHEMAHFLL